MKITSFKGAYSFLSNFYPCEIEYEGLTYPSVEHAYQAAKTADLEARKRIAQAPSAATAKALGKKVTLWMDWERVKVQVMQELLRKKFANPELLAKLKSTEQAELIEDNWWGDTFWGVSRGEGHNLLGRILMEIRDEVL